MSTPQPGTRRTRTIALAAAAGVAAVVAGFLVAQGGDRDGQAAPSPGSSATAGATPAPSSPTPSGASPTPDGATEPPTAQGPAPDAEPGDEAAAPADGPAPLATLPPVSADPPQVVPLDQPAPVGRAATARVVSVEDITASGTGIGEISGPALLTTVEVANTGSQELDLATFTVNAYLGAAGIPASPVTSDERWSALSGVLAPGATARGAYVFSAPPEQRGVLSVTVLGGLDTRLVVFQGEVAAPTG